MFCDYLKGGLGLSFLVIATHTIEFNYGNFKHVFQYKYNCLFSVMTIVLASNTVGIFLYSGQYKDNNKKLLFMRWCQYLFCT
jgi:hypothetical protein